MMLQGNGHAHSHSDSVVKIKSLPFDATQLDVLQFFDGFKMKPNGVQLVVRSDNKPTGEVRAEKMTLGCRRDILLHSPDWQLN